MLATELKKANFKSTLQLLVKEFNAHNFEDEMGGRKLFWIPDNDGDDIAGEISRDCDVCLMDNPEFEDKINQTIKEKVFNICWQFEIFFLYLGIIIKNKGYVRFYNL